MAVICWSSGLLIVTSCCQGFIAFFVLFALLLRLVVYGFLIFASCLLFVFLFLPLIIIIDCNCHCFFTFDWWHLIVTKNNFCLHHTLICRKKTLALQSLSILSSKLTKISCLCWPQMVGISKSLKKQSWEKSCKEVKDE